MTELITLTEELKESTEWGEVIPKLFGLELIGYNMEHREQMAKDLWQSFDEEELRLIQEDEQLGLIMSIALKSIFYSADPLGFSAEFEMNDLHKGVNTIIAIATLESLTRKGLLDYDGKYFYNPFEESDALFFNVGNEVIVKQEEILDKLYYN